MATVWDEFAVFGEEPVQVYSSKEALKWLKHELNVWEWLWGGQQESSFVSPADFAGFGIRLRQMIGAIESDDDLDPNAQNYLLPKQSIYAGVKNSMIVSTSRTGENILAIKKRVGEEEARYVFRAHHSRPDLNSIQSPVDMRGALLFAAPQNIDPMSFAEELKTERKRYRTEVSKLESRVRELEQEKRDREARRGKQMRRVVKRFRKVFETKSSELTSSLNTTAAGINATLIETEDRFRKQMELQAPVEYWIKKAKQHGRWEIGFAILSAVFFTAALFGLYNAALAAANYLLELPSTADRTPIYVITSGALLGVTTLIFWIGRPVIKLWLSEHHLRVDSNERAVMTKTYLAMTENGAASDEDRAIVLSAIFRPTPDGVVKEEGPHDMGLNSQLARLASRT